MTNRAILALEDGSVFHGAACGAAGTTVGEVVFNTAMTGYQEILTDPSYARQLVTLTYPHIGNTGTNAADSQSRRPMASGLIIRDLPLRTSNWRSEMTLVDYLNEHDVVAISDIDTRRLTRILREKGALGGCIMAGEGADEDKALEAAKGFGSMAGRDLAQEVTCDKPEDWIYGTWDFLKQRYRSLEQVGERFKVVAYDFGVKHDILRLLVDRGCHVHVVPAKTPADDVLALKPDGIFLSNGPGDPEPCGYAIDAIRQFIQAKVPLFGICLGHQLMGLAAGARTTKMKFGHHGANHPVQDLKTQQVAISSQNHGFAVDEKTLPNNVEATHRSLFDGSLQGIRLTDAPAFGFQGHPEGNPGPTDVQYLFDRFVELMAQGGEHAAS